MFFYEFIVVILAMILGARYGGVFFGMCGGLGLLALILLFGLAPASPPINVMLIMMSVVLAASTLQSSGGMAFLVRVAERLLRACPKAITFVSPIIAFVFTFMAGTGNVLYSILPVIAEVAREAGIRPERPISISVIASQHAVPASPISAATVAMVALLGAHGVTVLTIIAIVGPAVLIGLMIGALSVCRMGKELEEDPEYVRKVQEGYFTHAKLSVVFFLVAAVTVVFVGTFPELRPHVTNAAGKASQVSMTHMIELIMLVVSALMVLICKAKPDDIIRTSVFRAGMMGVVTIFGLAWMSDTWIANNLPYIKTSVAAVVQSTPWLFALALFFVSALTHSQGATVAALMPLGVSLGIDPLVLVCMYPAVCGYFIIPSTGVLLGGVAFDETGTTKIGKYVINHSYIIPGFVTTFANVVIAFGIKAVFF